MNMQMETSDLIRKFYLKTYHVNCNCNLEQSSLVDTFKYYKELLLAMVKVR